jgi:hypothetical protein
MEEMTLVELMRILLGKKIMNIHVVDSAVTNER